MDGIKHNGVALFLGKIPGRKQECFYFQEDAKQNDETPYASLIRIGGYVSERDLPEVKRLWEQFTKGRG